MPNIVYNIFVEVTGLLFYYNQSLEGRSYLTHWIEIRKDTKNSYMHPPKASKSFIVYMYIMLILLQKTSHLTGQNAKKPLRLAALYFVIIYCSASILLNNRPPSLDKITRSLFLILMAW